jgi:PAS domain S-box-containing protein
MEKTRILVVEDESIVAKDIQNSLIKLGYDVPTTASSAVTAFDKLDEIKPHLVFLDIKLKGDMDGIQIAERIKTEFDLPVIFLTSYVDKSTLDRAKITEPYGYLVKPFNEADLQSTIEMALYKFKKDQQLRTNKNLYANALSNLDEAILISDMEGRLTFLNPKAEQISGFGNDSAAGKEIASVLRFHDADNQFFSMDAFRTLIQNGILMTLNNATVTIARDNSTFKGVVTSSPVKDEKNQLIGNAFIIRQSLSQDSIKEPASSEASASPLPFDNLVIQNSFFVKKANTLVKVFLDNILWIQAMDNYIVIQTSEDQFIAHSTMRDIEIKLPPKRFIRVHRSFIIPMDKISLLDESTIMIGDKTIPLGKSYKDAFMERLNFL